ncbi:MAG TPA: hypothetical protein VII56_14295 [Rhizomicrobium sp.]
MRSKAVIGLLAVAASVALGAGARADDYANVHTVSVIVALDPAVTLREMSMLEFTEGEPQSFLPKTDFNGVIRHYVETALATRFTVVPPAPAALNLARLHGDDFRAALGTLRGTGVDAYVFVFPGYRSYGRINWSGFGLDKNSDSATTLYTLFSISAFDARTGANIDYGSSKFHGGGVFGGVFTLQTCDAALWPGAKAPLAADRQATVEAEILAAIKESVPEALSGAGLPDQTGYTPTSHSGDALVPGGHCHRG